jgi:hypothetical protein
LLKNNNLTLSLKNKLLGFADEGDIAAEPAPETTLPSGQTTEFHYYERQRGVHNKGRSGGILKAPPFSRKHLPA